MILDNMEKNELTVRDLIRKLSEFNMDAKVTVNTNGIPFTLYSDFSLCWDAIGDIRMSNEDRLETKKNSTEVTFDFTSIERKK